MEKRFWNKVDIKSDDECWLWKGGKDRYGYGRFYLDKKDVIAHRISYELHNNKQIKNGLLILHSCDNPNCVNPHHLSEGTYQDNQDDCVNRKRKPVGIHHNSSKLTDNDIIEIRNKYHTGNHTYQQLSIEYNISRSQIERIVNKKSWRHIE
jgi:hypothetical protein